MVGKNQIRKLGDRLRLSGVGHLPDDESLELLQKLRLSHKECLANVFSVLSDESRRIRKSRILTYRIKRIDTIISKLFRIPSMELDRMADIAGCRCIVDSVSEVHQVKSAIEKRVYKARVKDYIIAPQSDGYRGVHMYVKLNEGDKWPVEIQIRTRQQHYWATLVEILDVLYGSKLKDGEHHEVLSPLILLYAELSSLDPAKKLEFLTLENKLKIYSEMRKVFNANLIESRQDWLSLDETDGKPFFVIEVDENKRTSFTTFSEFKQAEELYFEKFKFSKSNVVLTHVEKPTFKQISLAYSNYVLISHQFESDLLTVAKESIEKAKRERNLSLASSLQRRYKAYMKEERQMLKAEMEAIDNSRSFQSLEYMQKHSEWTADMMESFEQKFYFITEGEKIEDSISGWFASIFSRILKTLVNKPLK